MSILVYLHFDLFGIDVIVAMRCDVNISQMSMHFSCHLRVATTHTVLAATFNSQQMSKKLTKGRSWGNRMDQIIAARKQEVSADPGELFPPHPGFQTR